MIALLSYLHSCYIRSYRFGPPVFIFLFCITFIYMVVPNPVMESYSFSISFLFVISAAISYSMIDIEAPSQEAVTMLHAGSFIRATFGKLLYSWLFTLPLALFAVLYPALFNKFDRVAGLDELTLSLLYHLAGSWLGITLACWFSSKLVRSRTTSFLSLSLMIVVAFCVSPLEKELPDSLKPLKWLLPPLDEIIQLLFHFEDATLASKLLALAAPLLYGTILCALFLMLLNKRRLDSL